MKTGVVKFSSEAEGDVFITVYEARIRTLFDNVLTMYPCFIDGNYHIIIIHNDAQGTESAVKYEDVDKLNQMVN